MRRYFSIRPDSLLGQLRSPMYLRWQVVVSQLWLIALFQVPWATKGSTASWLLPTLASLPVYLYLLVQVYIGPSRRMPLHIAGLVLLGLIVWPYNSVAFGYIVVATLTMALLPSWRHWLIGVVLIALLVVPMSLYLKVSVWLMLLVLMGSTISGISNFLYMRNLRKDAELRLSQEEVRRLAVLAERERIGRDLHDLLGHTLSLVALKSELARRLALSDPPRAQQEMEEVERVSRHALSEVRAAVTGMRRGDLAAELVSARLMLEASSMTFEDDMPATLALPVSIEAPLALVLREAITNIHRHARATTASVQFSIEGTRFGMCIRDNGCGGLQAHGNGISGMRERIRALHGTLDIDSPSRRGTSLRISVPLPEPSISSAGLSAVTLSATRSAA